MLCRKYFFIRPPHPSITTLLANTHTHAHTHTHTHTHTRNNSDSVSWIYLRPRQRIRWALTPLDHDCPWQQEPQFCVAMSSRYTHQQIRLLAGEVISITLRGHSVVRVCALGAMGRRIDPSRCSTTGVTNALICVTLSVG